jgi:hypothetical protein
VNLKNVLQFLNFLHYAEEGDRIEQQSGEDQITNFQLQSAEFSANYELQGGEDVRCSSTLVGTLCAASSGSSLWLTRTIHVISTRATTATVNSLGLCANDPANLCTYLCACVVLSGMIAAAAAIRKFRV